MGIIFISLAALCATFLGGAFALKFSDKLHLILGFSAGAVIGVAFFDLIPESISLLLGLYQVDFILSIVALGFIMYLLLDRFVLFHGMHTDDETCENEHHTKHIYGKGEAGASTLSIHSLIDGMAIGFAFKLSPGIGIIVATAVLAHDFSDGINTVNLIIKNGGSKRKAVRWLIVDSIAPVLGVLFTLFFSISETTLGFILAIFGGFFLYIGASDLLPESHHGHSMKWTTLMTVLGIGVIYCAIRIAAL